MGKKTLSRAARRKVYYMDKGCCHYCGRETVFARVGPGDSSVFDGLGNLIASVDHIVPRSKNGSNHPSNLINACGICNGLKGNMMPHEWERYCANNPEWWLI